MRKLKLLLTMLILLVGGVSFVNAQGWTASPVGAGTYYLYNVGAGKFLCSGNNWGSHASVTEGGIPVTLSASGGDYTISTAAIYSDKYLNGEWMDSDAMNWTFEEVSTNVYKIKNGDKVLFWNGSTSTNLSFGSDPGTTASEWKLVTEANRISDMVTATEASPLNVTFLIKNAYFAKGNNMIVAKEANLSSSPSWKGTSLTDLWGNDANSEEANYCPEQYRKTFDNYQELSGIPNGKYFMTAKGFYRNDGGSYAVPYIYANSEKCNLKIKGEDITNLATAAAAFVGTNYNLDGVTIIATDGNLRVGAKSDAGIDWCAFDDFQLIYYGKCIINEAVALPDGGAMTSGKWYYFDIPSNSDYNLTATTLDNIVYTTDATILIENQASVTTTFSNTNPVALTAGRYYIKSSSANNFAFEAHTKTYTVGDVTETSIADNTYQQSLTTVTFTLGDAASNDGTAALAIQGTPVAKLNDGSSDVADGALSIDNNVVTATFTSVALDPAKTYTITLPANAVAWDKNTENKNTAKVITFKTPTVFDGFYYLYNTDTETYLSRSGNYATQAIMDNRGLAVKIITDTEGKSIVQYFDNLLYLGNDGFCYGDAGTAHQFTVSAVEGGYKFLCVSNNKYLAVYEGQSVNDAEEGVNLQGTSNIWALETPAQHEANYTTNADIQAATAASKVPALSSITTKSALDTELDANYVVTNITITGSKNAKYQEYAGNSQALSEAEYYKETVENLKPGLYKLSVNAFQRAAWYDWVAAAGGARGNIYVYANNAKTQIKSVMEYGAASAYDQEGDNPNWAKDGKNYPNNDNAAYAALATGNYTNEVYVYVEDKGDGTGTLTFGINNPTRQGNGVNNGTWAVYNNWTLTRYISSSTVESVTVTAAGYATYVSTLPLDYTSTEIKAYTAKANTGKIVLTQINKVPANTPVVLYKEGGATEDIPVATTTDTPAASDLVAGTGAAVATAEGDYTNYILNVGTKGIGFYRANSQTVAANRAYMHVSNSETGSMSRMAIVFDNQTTGIANLKAAADGDDAIYNLNGQRIEKATKGVYIIDGKKIIMK